MINGSRRAKRLIAGGVVGLLGLSFAPTADAAISTTAFGANVPTGQSGFTDLADAGVHSRNVELVKASGVAQGTTATTYAPQQQTTRDQMASFVANLIDVANTLDAPGGTTIPDLPTAAASPNAFTDDNGNTHEANINRLAAADIVNGTGGTNYSPANPVRRDQMATFIAAALGFIRGGALPTGADAFTDDNGNTHEANINRLANADIVDGKAGAKIYDVAGIVSRAQMGSFTMQGAADLHADSFINPIPPPAQVVVTPADAATLADGTARSFSVTTKNSDGSNYAGNVIVDLFNTKADGTVNLASPATCANLQQIDGTNEGDSSGTRFAGTDGALTFLVRDVTGGATCSVIPRVVMDLDSDSVVDAGEPSALGGSTAFPFVAAEAADNATVPGGELVCGVSKTSGSESFVGDGTDGVCGGAAPDDLRYDFDSNDVFGGAEAPTFAAFLAQVTVGDIVNVTLYRRETANQSTFTLVNQTNAATVNAPTTPTDADTVTLTGTGQPGFKLTVYRDTNSDNDAGTVDDDFQLGTDVPLVTVTIADDATWSASVALLQNTTNHFVVVQRDAAQAENTAPANVVRDTQDVPTITESAAAVRPIITSLVGANGGNAGFLDPGDTVTLQANENLAATATASLTVFDSDGTSAVITRGSNATFVLADGTDADAVVGDLITITITGVIVPTANGTNSVVNSPAQVSAQSGLTATVDGVALNIASSTDKVIDTL